MDMIQKISVTASAMLFVLAQAFSLYMIGVSQREKLELMVEQEGELFQKCIREFGIQVDRRGYEGEIKEIQNEEFGYFKFLGTYPAEE